MWVPSLKNSLALKMRASGIYHCVVFIAIFPFKPAPKPHYFSEDHPDLFKIHPDPPTSFPSSFATFAQLFFCSLNVPLSGLPYDWLLVK